MTCAHATGGWGRCPARALGASARRTGRAGRGTESPPCPSVRCGTPGSGRMRKRTGPPFPQGPERKPLLLLRRPGLPGAGRGGTWLAAGDRGAVGSQPRPERPLAKTPRAKATGLVSRPERAPRDLRPS
ncbi:hypothetical protein NN561_010485 [Cricetulus griseus]